MHQVHKPCSLHFSHLNLYFGFSFIPAGGVLVSNMVVMEVQFPSGCTSDMNTISALQSTPGVKKVETKKGDTVIIIYFDNLDATELCVTIDAVRVFKVADQKAVPVSVYDYYDTCKLYLVLDPFNEK